MPQNSRGIHGVVSDSEVARLLLDLGNQLRYGQTEGERVEAVNKLTTPGVRDAAYGEEGQFDPAAAERYTSAYAFGNRFQVPEVLQPLLHEVSSGGRDAMHRVGVPGVGEERPELRRAEEMGMQRGSQAVRTGANPYSGLAGGLIGLASPLGGGVLGSGARAFLAGLTKNRKMKR